MESQNLAYKGFWLFFLFWKNANEHRDGAKRNRGERSHGTHSLGWGRSYETSEKSRVVEIVRVIYNEYYK